MLTPPRWIPRLALVVLCVVAGCTKTVVVPEEPLSPGGPTPLPPLINKLEYRVIGSVATATITYGSSVHGSTEVTTSVPWVASFQTAERGIFCHLRAVPRTLGQLRVQILANGKLVLEASAEAFDTAVVTGTCLPEP